MSENVADASRSKLFTKTTGPYPVQSVNGSTVTVVCHGIPDMIFVHGVTVSPAARRYTLPGRPKVHKTVRRALFRLDEPPHRRRLMIIRTRYFPIRNSTLGPLPSSTPSPRRPRALSPYRPSLPRLKAKPQHAPMPHRHVSARVTRLPNTKINSHLVGELMESARVTTFKRKLVRFGRQSVSACLQLARLGRRRQR